MNQDRVNPGSASQPPTIITYKKKRSSSGRLQGGKIYLSIAKGLSKSEEKRHIDTLTQKLAKQWVELGIKHRHLGPPSQITDQQSLVKLAEQINQRYFGFKYREIKFYTQYSLWGSCNWQKGIIHISHRLKGAPIELISYVIVHELAHLAVPNHSQAFWDIVAKGCPEYKQFRQLLRVYEGI